MRQCAWRTRVGLPSRFPWGRSSSSRQVRLSKRKYLWSTGAVQRCSNLGQLKAAALKGLWAASKHPCWHDQHVRTYVRQREQVLCEDYPISLAAVRAGGHLYHIRWVQDESGGLRLNDYWRDPISHAVLATSSSASASRGSTCSGSDDMGASLPDAKSG